MNQLFYSQRMQRTRHSERGMVLIITLLIMVAMLLVSTALLRSTGTSVQVVNNLSFRQAAEAPANVAVELAVQAIAAVAGTATPPSCPGNNFYSFRQPNESAEGIPALLLAGPGPRTGVCFVQVSDMGVTFIVEQMCANPTAGVTSANCLLSAGRGGGGGEAGEAEGYTDGTPPLDWGGGGGGGASPIHRVSMRVDGVKNTTVFAQAFID